MTRNRNQLSGSGFINIGAGGPFASDSIPSASGGGAVASALANSSSSPALSAVPAWVANRISHLDLNNGPIAKYFEHLANEDTSRAAAILVGADTIADEFGLDDELLAVLLVRFALE